MRLLFTQFFNNLKIPLLAFLIIILFFIFYKSEFEYNGNFREIFYLYFFLIIIFIILNIYSIFLPKHDKSIILFVINIFISLYLVEFFFLNNVDDYLKKKILSVDYDTRDEIKIYKNLTGKI